MVWYRRYRDEDSADWADVAADRVERHAISTAIAANSVSPLSMTLAPVRSDIDGFECVFLAAERCVIMAEQGARYEPLSRRDM